MMNNKPEKLLQVCGPGWKEAAEVNVSSCCSSIHLGRFNPSYYRSGVAAAAVAADDGVD